MTCITLIWSNIYLKTHFITFSYQFRMVTLYIMRCRGCTCQMDYCQPSPIWIIGSFQSWWHFIDTNVRNKDGAVVTQCSPYHEHISRDVLFILFVLYHDGGDFTDPYADGLVQEIRNSSALAMELRLSCTNPSMWCYLYTRFVTVLFQNSILLVPVIVKPHSYCAVNIRGEDHGMWGLRGRVTYSCISKLGHRRFK